MRFQFFKTALLLALIMALLLAYPLYAWVAPGVVSAVVAAGIIALVNVVLGAIIIEWAIDKPNTVFMGATFGGMVVRMMLVLLTFAVLIGNGMDRMALTFALMAFYLVFMIAEFFYITRELTRRKARARIASRTPVARNIVSRIASVDHRSN